MFFISCGNSTEFKESPIPQIQRNTPSPVTPTFSDIEERVLKPNCIQCHAGYSDYQVVFSGKEKILEAVLKGTMPKNAPALNNELKSLLNDWVSAGAPFEDDDGEDPPAPIELAPTWESLSKNVIFPKCVQCHNPNGQASFLDLSTRQKFFEQRVDYLNNFEDVANSYLLEVINDPDEPMPPVWSNIERLNEKEVKALIEWIENGLP